MTSEIIAKQTELEIAAGHWETGRYAWLLTNIRQIKPFPVKGKQGFFEVNLDADVNFL
jgi:hypothetical protein